MIFEGFQEAAKVEEKRELEKQGERISKWKKGKQKGQGCARVTEEGPEKRRD